MPPKTLPLTFDTDFSPVPGEAATVASGVVRVTAGNSGPYTFTGTNTYLVGNGSLAVIDPGPDDAAHLSAVLEAIDKRGVEAILLTHTHKDHSGLATKLQNATGAPIWFEGQHRPASRSRTGRLNPFAGASDRRLRPDRDLSHGEVLTFDGMALEVVATPGHTANHLAFGFAGTDLLFTGDHVMGWNSTLVAPPDGSLVDYLASLDRLIASDWDTYLPAHGGPIMQGRAYAQALRDHRQARLEQILDGVDQGAVSLNALLERIYPNLGFGLRFAAQWTLIAHIDYLIDHGELVWRRGLFGRRLVRS